MPVPTFAAELARYGPQQGTAEAVDRATAEVYCRELARRHYENFTVASWLLPRSLRQHFYHVYAYCRWADDLADEVAESQRSLALLDWWEDQLHAMYAGRASHPVFVALAGTVQAFHIPRQPLANLLIAFRQDQAIASYESWNELYGYCQNSANPVGRLVLYLGRCHREELLSLSDSVCTGLQLANFWQDIARDLDRGRVYVPREAMQAAGYAEDAFYRREFNPAFRRMMEQLVARAEDSLQQGWPLVAAMPGRLRIDMSLFIRGGLAILAAIRRQDYNVWQRRPIVSRRQKLQLLFASLWQVGRERSPVAAP